MAEGGGKASESGAPGVAVGAAPARDGTFMTAGPPGMEKDQIADPENMARVRDTHQQLAEVVGTLSAKVEGVLEKQEKDFLSAYRAHMFQVQKELQSLRAKANEAELAMKKNEKIRSLEEERNWYRKEALRLDKFATAMKRDLKYMKEKLESIEDDRNWLERQLKGSKKSNKLLRAELEIRLMSDQEAGGMGSTGQLGATGAEEGKERVEMFNTFSSTGPRGSSREGGVMFPPPGPSRGASRGQEREAGWAGGSARRGKVGFDRSGGGGMGRGMEMSASLDRISGGEEGAAMRSRIDKLEGQLAAERRTVKSLRAKAVAENSQRADLERFFVRCIDDVKREMARRKMKASQRGGHAKGSDSGPEDFGLGDFTATDRKRVIRRLLSDDYVLQMLHSMIFGSEGGAPMGPDGADAPRSGAEASLGDIESPSVGGGTPRSDGGIVLDPAVQDYLGMHEGETA